MWRCNNLRADRLGQWVLGDPNLVALGAIVQSTGCIRGHIGTIAITSSITILQIQLLVTILILGVVIVPLDASAVDGRLPEAITHPKAQLPLTIPFPLPFPFTLLHRLLLLLPEVGEEDRRVGVVFGATG